MTATPPKGSRALGPDSTGLEHRVAAGRRLTGLVPVKNYPDTPTVLGGTEGDDPVTAVPVRNTLVVASPTNLGADVTGDTPQDGNGLFDPYAVFSESRGKSIWITAVQFVTDQPWTVYVTSGQDSGDATTKDDPAEDVVLLRGTGNYFGNLGIELPKNSRVRVVTDAAVAAASTFCVRFSLTTSESGRLIS